MTRFTLNAAMEYAANDDIEAWIHLFLNGEGDNVGLSEGLKMKRRYWLGPIEINISYLERVVGPESNMEYVEDENLWNHNINQISDRIESGWDVPPLIAENREGFLSVRDGNHRLGALQKLNKEKCYVVIWDDSSVENILKAVQKKNKM
ncbi:ParB N-terminal domain-containing protein [Paenibacillus xylanexedens]|uniref:ParB N-terminal domain-containing protein n=1 Tax=Paenibacillus xylanexedens TaxID=528191 RepID=UPI0011A90911|nr:ParB N-terminal domain-containing protein [Paenibacillus xylanexedens]